MKTAAEKRALKKAKKIKLITDILHFEVRSVEGVGNVLFGSVVLETRTSLENYKGEKIDPKNKKDMERLKHELTVKVLGELATVVRKSAGVLAGKETKRGKIL